MEQLAVFQERSAISSSDSARFHSNMLYHRAVVRCDNEVSRGGKSNQVIN